MFRFNKTQKLVLLIALLFAAGSTIFLLVTQRNTGPQLVYRCFKTGAGWGYDISMNDKLVIHQPFVPGMGGTAGFGNEDQAREAAKIVIENIKSGKEPTLSHQQLQQLGVLRTQSK